MTKLEGLLKRQAEILEQYDGTPEEWETWFNDLQRVILDAFFEERGSAWLGQINVYRWEGRNQRIMWEWDGETPVRNFDATFVVPTHDEELEGLIQARLDAPYTGTRDDAKRLGPIFSRIGQLGGLHLFWT